jgi:phage tail-like protein
MATTAKDIKSNYPLPVYRFHVQVGKDSHAFSEVSGLDIGYEAITYKDGLGKIHMPGQIADVNITLKRGIVRKGSELYDWISSTKLNTIDKQDIKVILVDEADNPVITWTVSNAFPTKLTAPSFNGGSNEVAVEQLELRADEVRIEFPK